MKRLIGRRDFLAGGTALLAGLAGCNSGGGNPFEDGNGNANPNPDADRSVKIGVLAPQSGSLETFGPEVVDAVNLVKRQLEASEASITLDLSIHDTESDPETAVSAAQQLADDGYEAIVGPDSGEAANRIIEDVLNPESLVALSPLAADHDNNLDGEGRMFANAPTGGTMGTAISRPIAVSRVSSMAIVHSDNQYGRSIATRTNEDSSVRGIDVTAQVAIEDLEADSYTGKLEEAMADDPEAVVFATDPVTGSQLVQDYYSNHEPRTMFLTDRLRLPDLVSDVEGELDELRVVSLRPAWTNRRGGNSDDTGDETPGESSDAAVVDHFDRAFEAAYDRFPTIQAAQAFDATAILLLAAVKAGEDSYDGDSIRDEILNVSNQRANLENARTFGQDNHWEGISPIRDGVLNNYDGASNDIDFVRATGQLDSPLLHAAKFAPDRKGGFEQTLPIQT